jgi:hypothetical protein
MPVAGSKTNRRDDDDNEEEEEELGGTQTVEETLERIPLFEVLLLLLVGEICQQQQQLPVLALWRTQHQVWLSATSAN